MSLNEVLSRVFQGESVSEISSKLGISTSTVYSKISDFKLGAEEVGLLSAAKKSGVENEINQLVKIAKQVNKGEVTVNQCITGAKISKELKTFKVNVPIFHGFLESIHAESIKQEINPSEFVKYANDLKSFTQEKNITYKEFTENLEKESKLLEERNVTNNNLRKEIVENRNILRKEIVEKKTTLEQLDDFVIIRDALQARNLEVENLSQVESLLLNVEKQDFDAGKVIALFSEFEDVNATVIDLQKKRAQLSEEKLMLIGDNQTLQATINENRSMVKSVEQLSNNNLTPENIIAILKTIYRIGAEHGKTGPEAFEKLTNDLSVNYDPILGFEERRDNLKRQTETLEAKTNLKKEEYASLEKISVKKREALESYQTVTQLGVTDSEIIEWNRILEEHRFDVAGFRREIKKLDGVEALVEKKTSQIALLDDQIDTMHNLLRMAESETTTYRQNIANQLGEFEQIIATSMKKIEDTMSSVDADFTTPDTGFQARCRGLVEETHQKITELLSSTEVGWNTSIVKLDDQLKSILEKSDSIVENAYRGGTIVGKFHALEPINKMISGESLPRKEALLAIFTMLVFVKEWFNSNYKTELLQPCDEIITAVMRDL